MRIEANALRIADVVRVPGWGEGEVARRQEAGAEVRVWFRGNEDNDKPSMVFDAASSVEVARPGDLFVFKPPLAPRSKRIVDALTPLGWTFHSADGPGSADHLHDAIDMTRVEFQGDRVVAFVRIQTADGWVWPLSGLVLGTLDDFSADFENQINKLEAMSLLAQWEREAADKSRAKVPVPNTATLPRPVTGRPVVVRYSEIEGVLLCGDTRTHKDIIKGLSTPYRFRYSKRLPQGCAWYVQRSRGTVQERAKLEAVVALLRGRGVPVELDYVAPDSKIASPVAERHRPAAVPAATLRAVATTPSAASEPVEARGPGRPADRKRQAATLREVAARLLDDADAEIHKDRLENTRRRAEMASGIRARAYSEQVIAGALMLAADEVERGELTYIARLTTRPQIDDLEAALAHARYERRKETSERLEGVEPELADIPFARFTGVAVWKDSLRELMAYAGERVDAATRKRMRPLAEGEDQRVELIGNDVELLRPFLVRNGKEKLPHRIDTIADQLKRYDRLGRLGVRDTASLRAALREYLGCCRGHQKRQADDPLAAAKRELQFAKIPGFFPTPRPLAERLVSLAAIEPGMRVLEPSAGSGSIAEVIRERHPDTTLEVIEFNMTLRGLLQAQGFAVVSNDFLGFAPESVRYDRILMNPPFELRQDTQHIVHALDLLAPGGRLIAIASGSLISRSDKETAALRERIERLGGRIEKLPERSFADSGTDVHTVLVVVDAAPAKAARPRPALAVVPVVAREAETDCGCEHAEPEPAPKREPVREVAAKPTPVVVREPARAPTVAAVSGPIDPAAIAERWQAAEERRHAQKIWKNIPKTSCFEIRDGDEDSVTLCTAFQPKPVGDCPPMSRETQTFGLCEQGEPVEYFGRGTDNKGIIAAKAEGAARFTRARDRRAAGVELELGPLPAGDDFEALQAYLDRLVPSRVVYRPEEPFVVIDVRPERPQFVTPDGERLPLSTSSPIPPGSTLEPRVNARGSMALVDFVGQLAGDDLLVYRGPVDAEVLRKVVKLASADLQELAIEGGSIADVQHGKVGERTVYWLPARDGSRVHGPIQADGERLKGKAATDFGAQHGATIGTRRPPEWDPSVAILIALQSKGKPFWLAWNRETGEVQARQRGGAWKAQDSLPATSTWSAEKGFADFSHVATHSLIKRLEEVDRSVRFRVSGPWLGVLWPSDFGKRVEFDPPTGGTIDLEEVRARYADQLEFAQQHGTPTQAWWAKLEAGRVKWAEKWVKDQQQAAKPKRAPKPERAPKPTPEPRPKLAVVPAGDVDQEQEQPMKTATSAKKKATKAKPAKKAAASKPAAKKATAKKAASKPAARKATAKKAASKPVAKKATAKKATASKPAAKPSAAKVPAEKVIAPKSAGPACEASDDTCPPELDSWRNRLRQGDRVRFRKNSKIAAALGIRTDRVFEVRCTVCREGQRFAILDLGLGSANDVAIQVGQFAMVERSEAAMPDDVRECVAKLAKLDAPLAPETRRLVAKLARGR